MGNTNEWFSVNLVFWMAKVGIPNPRQLSLRVGVDRATAGRWVKGESLPEGPTLTKLCAVLGGVDVRDLMDAPKDAEERINRALAHLQLAVGEVEADVVRRMMALSIEKKRQLHARIVGWIEALDDHA